MAKTLSTQQVPIEVLKAARFDENNTFEIGETVIVPYHTSGIYYYARVTKLYHDESLGYPIAMVSTEDASGRRFGTMLISVGKL